MRCVVVAELMAGLPPGSYLTAADGTSAVTGQPAEQAQQGYNASGALPYVLRTPAEIAGFFDGLELVEPGLMRVPEWRPDSDADLANPATVWGGVARKN